MSVTTMLRATKKQDMWYTPDYAVKALLPFLPKKSKILCPFDQEDSQFPLVLHEAGHSVKFSHIEPKTTLRSLALPVNPAKDFFTYTSKEVKQFDFISSNPPYSQKDAVFEKLFELGRPFCMLMGATAGLFEGKRFSMWQKENESLTVIWLSPRVAYIDQSGAAMKSPPFQSAYVCWQLFEPHEHKPGHIFWRVEK